MTGDTKIPYSRGALAHNCASVESDVRSTMVCFLRRTAFYMAIHNRRPESKRPSPLVDRSDAIADARTALHKGAASFSAHSQGEQPPFESPSLLSLRQVDSANKTNHTSTSFSSPSSCCVLSLPALCIPAPRDSCPTRLPDMTCALTSSLCPRPSRAYCTTVHV